MNSDCQPSPAAPARWTKPAKYAATLLSVIVLGACGNSNTDDEHTHTHIESDGRLAVFDVDAQVLKVIDLEDGSTLDSFTLDGSATPSLYTIPGQRYAAVIQRDDNLVSFLDSGLYTEDHGDHQHDYEVDPRLLNFTLTNVKPTHFEAGEDTAIIFNDGSEASVSSVTVFSGASIASGETLFELNRENNMHGAARLIDDHLFVTYRDASITDTTLPAEVERYAIDGNLATFEERYDEQCPRLHGAGYNHETLIFGCSDGILAIDLEDSNFAASKYDSPASMDEGSRIGTVYAHHDVEALITRAGSQLFATVIDEGAVSYEELNLEDGASPLGQGFTPNGEYFWVVADDEQLYLWEVSAGWSTRSTTTISEDDITSVTVAASSTDHLLYVLDINNQRIVEIDYEAGSIGNIMNLGFTPSGLAWMGLADHDHDEHDHGHEEEHDDDHDHDEEHDDED